MTAATEPELDLVMLSWNRADDTIAALRSAIGQIGVEARIIVVDQGSDAGELARLDAYLRDKPQVVFVKLGRNLGVPGGRNAAIALGSAPLVVAIDSDAVFADHLCLRRTVDHMNGHPMLCAIGFRITNYFTGENDRTCWDYPARCRPAERFPATRFIGAGHCIRRHVFERVGGYDAALFFCGEELDLCYRMLGTGHRIEYFPAVEILHKVSPDKRVRWDSGRFRLTVRNNLYTLYKFGTPWPRRALAAAAFVATGLSNGVAREALKGVWQSRAMNHAHDRRPEREKRAYRLGPETWGYILDCEPGRRESIAVKIARQFRRLPRHA